jgi:hypothetical protein
VNHSRLVRFFQPLANLDAVLQHQLRRQRAFHQAGGEGLALQEFHDQKIGAILVSDVVQRANVGMIQRGDGARLTLEALFGLCVRRKMRRQNLDRNVSPQPRIARAIHFAHAPRAKGGLNLVGSEFRASGESHRCA